MAHETDLDPCALARLHRLGGERLQREMLELFLHHVPSQIESAMIAERDGDIRALERAVHSLKSSAGNVGACALQSLADDIERLAEANDAEKLCPLVLNLHLAWKRLEPLLHETLKGLKS